MHKELKNEFVEHSKLILSSSVLDNTPKFYPRGEFSSIQMHFSAAC